MPFTCEESFIKFVNVRDEIQNEFIKSSIKKWAVSSVEDQCKINKMDSIGQKTGSGMPDESQNHRHMTELICSQKATEV